MGRFRYKNPAAVTPVIEEKAKVQQQRRAA
jgi:hypothetical protein